MIAADCQFIGNSAIHYIAVKLMILFFVGQNASTGNHEINFILMTSFSPPNISLLTVITFHESGMLSLLSRKRSPHPGMRSCAKGIPVSLR